MARHDPPEALSMVAVADQHALAGRSEHVYSTIDPDDLARLRQCLGFTFALEDGPPAAVFLGHEGAAEVRNRTALAQPDRTNAGDTHPFLVLIEFQCAVAVREFELLPARFRLEAGITGSLPVLDASKERGKPKVQSVQHRVHALAVDRGEPAVLCAERRDLRILHLRCNANATGDPGVPALIEQRIMRLPRHVEHELQMLGLGPRGIETNAVHPAHTFMLAPECATMVAHSRARRHTLQSVKRPEQRTRCG